MNIPTAKELNPYGGIDAPYIEEQYFGKTIEELECELKGNVEFYTENLMYLGPIGFSYYFRAFRAYVLSENSLNDGGVFDPLYMAVLAQVDQHKEMIKESYTDIIEVATHIVNNWESFCPIDGDDYDCVDKWQGLRDSLDGIGAVEQ